MGCKDLFQNDNIYTYITNVDCSGTRLIVDTKGRIMAILVGCPADGAWSETIDRMGSALNRTRVEGIASGAFSSEHSEHRRGKFLAVASGVSFGGGQMVSRMHPT